MPHVTAHYDSDKLKLDTGVHRDLLVGIGDIIRQKAPQLLSVDERPLTADSFSFSFLPSDPRFDHLVHTVQVVISAHNFRARMDLQDVVARSLRIEIEQLIQELSIPHATVSVSLHLHAIGYSSSSDDTPNTPTREA